MQNNLAVIKLQNFYCVSYFACNGHFTDYYFTEEYL